MKGVLFKGIWVPFDRLTAEEDAPPTPPTPEAPTVEGPQPLLYTADGKPLTRKIGF